MTLPISRLVETFSTQVFAAAVGPHQQLTLPHLIRLFQEGAMRNTKRLGIATPTLMEQYGLTWVLHRQIIRAERWPTIGEPVRVLTVPVRMERQLLTYRDFYLLDDREQPIITATSAWSVMSLSSRRLKPLPGAVSSLLTDLPPAAQQLPWPDDKPGAPHAVSQSRDFRVDFADLDFNNHLTNPAFAELMLEPLGADYLRAHLPRRADISYRMEARYGDQLTASTAPSTTPPTFDHGLYRGDELLASMQTEWMTR